MASILTPALFTAEYMIAQADTPGVSAALNVFISKYEKDYMQRVLGAQLATAFIAGLAIEPLADHWKDIRDGKTFSYNGEEYTFIGLANNTTKESVLALYVYYFYQANEATKVVGSGTMISQIENGAPTNNSYRMVEGWNQMVDQTLILDAMLKSDSTNYVLYKGVSKSNQEYFSYINTFNL